MTKEEQKIIDLITKAHNLFMLLEESHSIEKSDWINGIHKLQYVLGMRILRRDYPSIFN